MNKKNLSVVMAGAMLATSVAPVLAEETTTATDYSIDNISLLGKQIVDTMKTKMISTNAGLKLTSTGATAANITDGVFVKGKVADLMVKNASAFGVRIYDASGELVDLHNINSSIPSSTVTYETDKVEGLFSSTNVSKIKPGYKIELVERYTTDFHGQIIPGTRIVKGDLAGKYTPADDFGSTAIAKDGATYDEIAVGDTEGDSGKNALVQKIEAADSNKKLVVTLNKLENPTDKQSNVTITLDKDSDKIDGRLPLTADGKLLDFTSSTDVSLFDHFDTLATTYTPSDVVTKAPTVKNVYKLTASESVGENTFKAADLYDGIVLTSKGTEIAADLNNARNNVVTTGRELVKLSTRPTGQPEAPIYEFKVFYYKNEADSNTGGTNGTGAYKTITVYSSNYKELVSLYDMIDPTSSNSNGYEVGIVGGANRYETAVNVAKQNNTTVAANGNIVLVNGESLVDGLAAAPLAASLGNKAPVLLTKADSLPESTKEYIKLLTDSLSTAQKKAVTINLVGGESVLSSKLVSELENMGFYVKRLGGKDRESTSLKVAEEIAASTNTNAAFVVGGNGEADAMAISAVAAQQKAPIIVSSVHGLSDNALTYLNEKSAKGDVTIIGGTSVVSESEEKAINDALVLNKAVRIAGDTRFETNANIIKEYYKQLGTDPTGNSDLNNLGAASIVVVKDGMSNKSELVDALSAANYAASNYAPIVLASKELKASQKNALLNVDTVKGNGSGTENSLKKALQIGDGGSRTVLEAVANLFGLSNVK